MRRVKRSGWESFLKDEKSQRKLVVILSLVVGLVMCVVTSLDLSPYKYMDYSIYDFFTSKIDDKDTSNTITIVDIDDRSLKALGQWPWPRYRMAALLLNLQNAGAASVGLDIVFSEPDRTSINNIIKSHKNELGVETEINGLPEYLHDNDAFFAKVLASGPFVLSNFIFFDDIETDDKCILSPVKVTGNINYLPELLQGSGFLCNLEILSKSVEIKGFFNAFRDRDGTLRKLPLIARVGNKIYPSLSLATLLNIRGQQEVEVGKNFNGPYIKVWDRKVPVDRQGNVLFNTKNNHGYYKYISAIDILTGNFDRKDIMGKLVFIGSTAVGLNDLHNVAGNSYFPGVELHATFVDNLMMGEFFSIPSWYKLFEILSILVLGTLLGLILSYRKTIVYLLSVPVLVSVLMFGTYLFLRYTYMYVSPLGTSVSLVVVFLVVMSLNYFFEIKKSLLWAHILTKTHEATIGSMATVAETRDPETGAHIIRTQYYVKELAMHLSEKDKYKKVLTPGFIDLLFKSAPMHDIGKVGVSDSVLLKPGKLNDEEMKLMQKHAEYGLEIINSAQEKIPENEFLSVAADIAYTHHEKWDGTGYPRGLKNEDIPLAGRLMAVADVYDALISKRHYKEPMSHENAFAIIAKGRGLHFDPDIVDAFIEIDDKFKAISQKYSDVEVYG